MSRRIARRAIVFDLLLIAGFACILDGYYFLRNPNYLTSDSASYVEPGTRLVNGLGFTSNLPLVYAFPEYGYTGIAPDMVRTPGYPLLVGLWESAGLSFRGLVALQHLLNVGVSLALYLLILFAKRPRAVALGAGLLRSANFTAIAAANLILTETVFSVCVAGCMWLAYAAARQGANRPVSASVGAGLLAGIAALVRPVAVYLWLPLAAVVYLSAGRRRRVSALALALSAMVVTGCWAARNYRASGSFSIAAGHLEGLLIYPAAGALVLDDKPLAYGITAWDASNDFHLRMHRLQPKLVEEGNRTIVERTGRRPEELSYAARAGVYRDVAVELIREHPRGTALLVLASLGHQFLGELWETATTLGMDYRAAKIRFVPLAAVVLLLAGIGAVATWRENRPFCVLLVGTVGYFSATAIGQPGVARYFIPAMIGYAALVSEGVFAAATWARSRGIESIGKTTGEQTLARP